MAIDIQSLFADILPDPAKELEEKALTRSALISKGMQGPWAGLAATMGYDSALSGEGMRRAANQLTGGRMSTPTERINKAAQTIDTTTPQGQAQLLSIVRKERGPGAAEQLREVFLERNRQKTELELQERQVAAQEKGAETSALSAQNYGRQVDAQVEAQEARIARETALDELARQEVKNQQFVRVDGRNTSIALIDNKAVMLDEEGEWVPLKGEIVTQSGQRMSAALQREMLTLQQSAIETGQTIATARKVLDVLRERDPSRWQLLVQSGLENVGQGDPELQLMMKDLEEITVAISAENLPAGPASDVDVINSRRPIPSVRSDADLMRPWVEGRLKQAIIKQAMDDARAAWIEANPNDVSGFNQAWRTAMNDPEYVSRLFAANGLTLNIGGSPETDAARAERLRAERQRQAQPKPPVPGFIDEQRY